MKCEIKNTPNGWRFILRSVEYKWVVPITQFLVNAKCRGQIVCALLLACNQWQSIPHLGESITMLVVLISVNHTSCRV